MRLLADNALSPALADLLRTDDFSSRRTQKRRDLCGVVAFDDGDGIAAIMPPNDLQAVPLRFDGVRLTAERVERGESPDSTRNRNL